MAETYAELQQEIELFLDNNNPNLIAAIPIFISDAEKSFGRRLHTRDMECLTTTPLVPVGTTDDTLGVYDIPDDWGGSKSISISGDTLVLHYWRKIPALSATNADNWLLLKYPDLYRYASLQFAEPFLKNDSRVALWSSAAESILAEVDTHDEHDLFSGGPLQARSGRPWVGDGRPGRLEYIAPFDFLDMTIRDTLATNTCAGWFTLMEDKIRIWPKPDISTASGAVGWVPCA